MDLKRTKREPKIQRGISLSRDLHERIQTEADRFGMTWNEAAEAILERGFPANPNSSKTAISVQESDSVEVA